jgi:hypothetical protein
LCGGSARWGRFQVPGFRFQVKNIVTCYLELWNLKPGTLSP